MKYLEDYTLTDFLELAVRHQYIASYQIMDENRVVLVVDGEDNVLDQQQAWSWVSCTLYDWWQQQALNAQA